MHLGAHFPFPEENSDGERVRPFSSYLLWGTYFYKPRLFLDQEKFLPPVKAFFEGSALVAFVAQLFNITFITKESEWTDQLREHSMIPYMKGFDGLVRKGFAVVEVVGGAIVPTMNGFAVEARGEVGGGGRAPAKPNGEAEAVVVVVGGGGSGDEGRSDCKWSGRGFTSSGGFWDKSTLALGVAAESTFFVM